MIESVKISSHDRGCGNHRKKESDESKRQQGSFVFDNGRRDEPGRKMHNQAYGDTD